MTNKLHVSFDSLITKASRNDKGEIHLTAIASDNFADTRDDAISENGLEIMREMAIEGVDILETHNSTFALGKTVGGTLVRHENGLVEFATDMVLQSTPATNQLFDSVEKGEGKYKMSVGLAVDRTDPEAVMFKSGPNGEFIRVLNKFALDHIAVTRESSTSAINQRTRFLTAIKKGIEVIDAPADIEKVLDNSPSSSVVEDANHVTLTSEEIMTNTIQNDAPSVTADELGKSVGVLAGLGKALFALGLMTDEEKAASAVVKSDSEVEDEVTTDEPAADETEAAEADVVKAEDEATEEVTETESAEETVEKSDETDAEDEAVEATEAEEVVEEKSEAVEAETEDSSDESAWDDVDSEIEAKADKSEDSTEAEVEEKAEVADPAAQMLQAFFDQLETVTKSLDTLSDRLDNLEGLEAQGGDDAPGAVHVVEKSNQRKADANPWKGIIDVDRLRSRI